MLYLRGDRVVFCLLGAVATLLALVLVHQDLNFFAQLFYLFLQDRVSVRGPSDELLLQKSLLSTVGNVCCRELDSLLDLLLNLALAFEVLRSPLYFVLGPDVVLLEVSGFLPLALGELVKF